MAARGLLGFNYQQSDVIHLLHAQRNLNSGRNFVGQIGIGHGLPLAKSTSSFTLDIFFTLDIELCALIQNVLQVKYQNANQEYIRDNYSVHTLPK
jgi:hypothetical protein